LLGFKLLDKRNEIGLVLGMLVVVRGKQAVDKLVRRRVRLRATVARLALLLQLELMHLKDLWRQITLT
jgi:hypothetical protein